MPAHRPTTASALRLLVACVALLWAACGGGRVAPPPDGPQTTGELLAAVEARLDGIDTLRVRAVAEYFGEEGRVRVRQAVVAAFPDRIRVETLSPFDATLSVLASDGRTLRLYDLGEERFWEGEASARNVARLIPVWLTPGDLVRVLAGAPPLSEVDFEAFDPEVPPAWDGQRGAWRATLPRRGGGAIDLWITDGSWTMTAARVEDAEGTLHYELRSARLRESETEGGAVAVPRVLRFLMPARGIDLSLDVEDYRINPLLPDAIFVLEPPRGVPVESLDGW